MSTLRDPNQIVSAEHDEPNNAKRVIVVAGELPSFKVPEIDFSNMKMPEIKFPEFVKVEVPVIVPETKIVEVPVPVVSKEIQVVETQIVVPQKELQIEKVEIPVVVKEYETIQTQVIVKETEFKEILPKWVIGLIVAQSVISILTALLKLKL